MNTIVIIFCIALGFVIILSIFYNWYVNHFFKKLKLFYHLDETKKVIIEKNLNYKTNGKNNLLMDVYKPDNKNNGAKIPVIIFLHGEGIKRIMKDVKEWSFYTTYGRVAASKGFAAITFHRSRNNSNFNNRDVAEDILDAVDFVRKNAASLNVDEKRICIWGFSLGGLYLSLFLKKAPAYIRCIISYYGLLDIKARVKDLNELNREYQPEFYLPENGDDIPPLLIVKAEKDKVKGVNKSHDNFISVAQKRHIPYEFILHNTGGHTFDALNDNDETRRVMDETWKFINRNI